MKKCKFKIETYHTKKTFEDFAKFSYKVQHPGAGFRVFMFGACLLTIAYMTDGFRRIIALILGIFLVTLPLVRHKIAAAKLAPASDNYVNNKPVIFEFYARDFTVQNIKEDRRLSYSQITPAYADASYFYLGIDNEVMHLIPRNAFLSGTPDEFEDFLTNTWNIELPLPRKNFRQRFDENLQKARLELKKNKNSQKS